MIAPGMPAATAVALNRPTIIGVLALLQFIGAAFWGMIAAVLGMLAVAAPHQANGDTNAILIVPVLLGLAAYQAICGIGLWRLRSYGRTMQMIAAAIGLLGIPIGTIIGIAILIYLSKPGIKVLFSGKTAEELNPSEVAAVQALASSGAGAAILIVTIALAAVFFVGIIAAIAVPGLLRARIAGNEATAIGALRAISSAETTYAAAANGGYYDSQACLVRPSGCVPGYRGDAFLAEEYSVKSGYRFELGGESPGELRPGGSRTSLKSFVVVATPLSPSTGTRSFCVDDTAVIRSQRADAAVPQQSTACPSSWPPLQ